MLWLSAMLATAAERVSRQLHLTRVRYKITLKRFFEKKKPITGIIKKTYGRVNALGKIGISVNGIADIAQSKEI